MRRWTVVLAVVLAAAACAGSPVATRRVATRSATASTAIPVGNGDRATIRLLFAGDVMLGRNVAPIAAAEGPGIFEGVRYIVSSADLAAANLESPLTTRPHTSDSPNDLRAEPETAALLAGAGFDLLSLANNHSGDAGPDGFRDTLSALAEVGIEPLGVVIGNSPSMVSVDVGDVEVAFLAYDTTHLGQAPSELDPGTAFFDLQQAGEQVVAAARQADVVVVSLHGGIEYLLNSDPILGPAAIELAAAGADIVWGHGPHVPQPLAVENGAVIATSLGNLLFDQQRVETQSGVVLEVLASTSGVVAYRTGRASHRDARVSFEGWDSPSGDSVLLGGEWWNLATSPEVEQGESMQVDEFPFGDPTIVAVGDANSDGLDELVVSYRHAFRANPVNALLADHELVDAGGRSAHLGVFDIGTMDPLWAAGTMLRPVAQVAVCDGSMALAFDSLDAREVVATGAWTWWGFGFSVAPELLGSGEPGCADVDLDGRTDPVVLNRSSDSDHRP